MPELNQQNEKMIFIEKFISFCQQHDIWYALDATTLLSAYHYQNFSKFSSQFQVMMTYWSYQKLKRLAPLNVLDSFINSQYKSLKCAFVNNNRNWHSEQPFIEIRLVIPTTTQKVYKFTSYFTAVKEKILRVNFNINYAINFLYENKNQGYFFLDNRFKNISKNWNNVIIFSTTQINFAHFKVPILKNSKMLLEHWYGSKWLNPEKLRIQHHYLAPLKKIKPKKKAHQKMIYKISNQQDKILKEGNYEN